MTTNFFVTPSTRVVEKDVMIMNALDPLNFSFFFFFALLIPLFYLR